MLWIETYRPTTFDAIVGQETVVRHLASFAAQKNVPHMIVFGPHGTGKSASIECMARALYGDSWQENTTVLSAEDLFSQGKAYLEQDERFSHIFQKDASLINNVKYIIRWYASIRPLDADFKLMVIESADRLTFEAQQALRRIMERYSSTCRFIFCTTNPSAIIPAITSRCLPLFFAPLAADAIHGRLQAIMREEGVGRDRVTPDDLELIEHAAKGDLRKAIMLLQLHATRGGGVDIADSETLAVSAAAFAALREKQLEKAAALVQSLMVDYGLSGREVIRELRTVATREYNDERITVALAETDALLGHAGNEFLQIDALLARIVREVFA
ncbi:MAG: AAA family ATPase [Methanomicrobiaceae archaeon]|nr:AAA family ATPase [Methanomicrobiaceae archaeon]